MTAQPDCTLVDADWRLDQAAIMHVRRSVFVQEQGIPEAQELDGQDPECQHVLALGAAGEPVATGRLMPDGRIGRMAVMPAWRHRGVGRAVLLRLQQLAVDRGVTGVYLHAQQQVEGFYLGEGYRPEGAPFVVAGIPHLRMVKELTAAGRDG